MGVIHFSDLDEVLDELRPGQTVRMAVLDVTEQTFKKLTKRGFDVRPGVSDLGNARPLAGGWSRTTQTADHSRGDP